MAMESVQNSGEIWQRKSQSLAPFTDCFETSIAETIDDHFSAENTIGIRAAGAAITCKKK
jgi:hypothetical protein